MLFCITTSGIVLSQDSEADLKATAEKLFAEEKYGEAKSYVERLLALQPRSHDYQYKYGTCLLYSGYKKTDAFKYLQYSVTDPNIDVSAFYFLGKAYHLTYNFAEAIKNYNLYKQKAGSKINAKYEVDRQIEMCQSGKVLLSGLNEIVVLEKKEYSAAEFFRVYDLRNIGGTIIVAYDFQSKIDKKKNYVPLIHFPSKAKTIYYASYGETDKGNKDLYFCTKMPDGTWSKPQLVPGAVNTNADEDFPYMHPDGEHLYFSSKGHNSMGGYDVFQAEKNAAGAFVAVQNVDFAISSADNDMFYVVDSLNQRACFASARQANNGKMFVYTVKVDRLPMQTAVIKGEFTSTIKPENKKITIVVKEAKSNKAVGTYVSDNKGSYLVTLPKSGTYIYEMKVDGSSTVHKYEFNVPSFKEFHPLKQFIQEDLADASTGSAKEKVTVSDRFSENFDDPSAILAEVVNQKSELNVNVQNFSEEQLNPSSAGVLATLGLNGKTPAEKANAISDIAETQEDKVKGIQKLVDGARLNAVNALAEADQKQNTAKTLVGKSANETEEEKYKLLKEAQVYLNQANDSKEEAKMLLKFADSVTATLPAEQKKLDELKQLSTAVNEAAQNDDEAKIKQLVEERSEVVVASKEANAVNPIQSVIDQKKKVVAVENKLEQEMSSYKTTEKNLGNEISALKENLAAAKTKDKPEIESKIAAKEKELGMVQDELKYQEKKLDQAKTEEKILDAKLKFLQDVNNTVVSNAPTADVAKQRLADVDSKNSRTLSDYVNQQVTELEKKENISSIKENPTTAEINEAVKSEWEDVQKVIENKASEEKSLDESTNLTAQEKAKIKVANDQKAITAIDDTKADLEKLLEKSPENAEIKTKIAALDEEKKKTQAHLVEQEKIASAASNTTPVVVLTPEKQVEALYPTYQAEKTAVKESNPLDQLTALNKIDQKLLDKTNSELAAVNTGLEQNPASTELLNKKAVLEKVKSQTEGNIASREKAIASMQGTTPVALTNEKLIEQLSPSYENKKAAITSTDPRTVLEEQNELDQELLFTINAEKNKVNQQLTATPNDKALTDRKTAIESLETKVKKDIAARETEIEKLPEAVVQSSPEKELTTIEPDYQRKLNAIDKSTPEKELAGRIALNNEVLNLAKDELAQINETLASQPNNATAENRKTAISELISKLDKDVEADKEKLDALNVPVADNNAKLKEEVRPEYQSNIAKIEASDKNEADKAIDKLKEEQALLTAIDNSIKTIDKQLAKTPNDQTLKDKKAGLVELQAIQESKVQEDQEMAIAIERAKIEPAELQRTLAPKFTVPSKSQLANQNTDAQDEMRTAEQNLRETLIKKLQANEKANTKTFNPKLVAENRAINALVQESVERENRIGEASNEPSAKDLLVQTFTPEQTQSYTEKPNSKETTQEYWAILEELQTQLQKDAVSPDFSSDERNVKREQIVLVQQRLNELNVIEKQFDNLTSTNNTIPNDTNQNNQNTNSTVENSNSTSESIATAKLVEREAEIKKELATATPKEKKELEKELTKITAEKAVIQDSLNTTAIADIKKDQNQIIESLPQDNAVVEVIAERKTNPELTKEEQRLEEQKKLSLIQAAAVSENAREQFEKENVVIASNESLERAKRRFTIEIGDLTAERANLGNSAQDEQRKTAIDKEVVEFSKAITAIDEMQAQNTANVVENNLSKEGLEANVTPEKENEIRSNPEYQKALVQQQELTQVIQQRKGVAKAIADEQAKFENGDPTASVEQLKTLIEDDKNLKSEQERIEAKLRSNLAANGTDAEAWKNVVSREMPYIKPAVSDEVLAPFVADGFKINQPNENVKPVLNKDLPIGLKLPSGLVYRVQVGAFAKPVPEELFKEFTPVTGEKLPSGITRYMAGFFGNRNKVLDAQKQIRALGYTDAFVVAYCDGERISLAEARRLEDAGLCIPKDQNEIAIEVTQSVIAQLPQDSIKPKVVEIKPGDYNKAEGAAVAMAVEEKLGLFYTVQVGVYNKPVPSSQLKDIDPLVTKRLPNGQIRYSSGVFQSVNSAMPKKKEAIALGITDAFITAYYKGERISLEEAKRILKDQGASVLEPLETPVQNKVIETQVAKAIEQERSELKQTSNVKAELVSSSTYPAYPTKEIELLNTVGTFYYDTLDLKIKSATYSSVNALPALANLPVSFDTLQVGKIETAINENSKYAEIRYSESISGALANYLLRANIPFELISSASATEDINSAKMRIYASKTGNFDVILNQLQLLGVSAEVQNEE